jgi:hypothetical protein
MRRLHHLGESDLFAVALVTKELAQRGKTFLRAQDFRVALVEGAAFTRSGRGSRGSAQAWRSCDL